MKKTLLTTTVLTVLMMCNGSAATIVWGAPQNITSSVTDVLSTGTTVEAFNGTATGIAGATVDVNGVTFTNTGSLLNNNNAGDFFDDVVGTGTYDTLLSTVDFGNNSQPTLTINFSGLSIGQQYTIQYWYAADSTEVRTMSLTATGTTTTGAGDVVLDNTDAGAGNGGRYAIGNFTADAATQDFTILSSANGVRLHAYQLRAVPEPGTFALLWAGLGMLFLVRRRR